MFLYINSKMTEKLFIKVFKSNKQNYFQTKQMLSHCIIYTKTCALSGWVLLGLHFYLTRRYNTAIHVLEFTKSLTSLGQFTVSFDSHISIRDILSKTNREYGFLNIFQKIRLKTAKIISLSSETEDQSFITDELLQRYPGDRDIFCPPGVLLYYLMFISYHRLNDISRRQDCLHDLKGCGNRYGGRVRYDYTCIRIRRAGRWFNYRHYFRYCLFLCRTNY